MILIFRKSDETVTLSKVSKFMVGNSRDEKDLLLNHFIASYICRMSFLSKTIEIEKMLLGKASSSNGITIPIKLIQSDHIKKMINNLFRSKQIEVFKSGMVVNSEILNEEDLNRLIGESRHNVDSRIKSIVIAARKKEGDRFTLYHPEVQKSSSFLIKRNKNRSLAFRLDLYKVYPIVFLSGDDVLVMNQPEDFEEVRKKFQVVKKSLSLDDVMSLSVKAGYTVEIVYPNKRRPDSLYPDIEPYMFRTLNRNYITYRCINIFADLKSGEIDKRIASLILDSLKNGKNEFSEGTDFHFFFSREEALKFKVDLEVLSYSSSEGASEFIKFDNKVQNLHNAGYDKTSFLSDYIVEDGFKGQLKDHQIEGLNYIYGMYSKGTTGCLLADDPGMGKTIQSIAFLHAAFDPSKNYLILCPVSVVENWKNEIARFSPKLSKNVGKNIQITSVETFSYNSIEFSKIDYEIVIIDESQNLKNRNTINHSNIRSLNRKFVLALSGTPIENSVQDVVSVFELLQPDSLSPLRFFIQSLRHSGRSDSEIALVLKDKVSPLIMARKLDSSNLQSVIEQNTIQVFMNKTEKSIYRDIVEFSIGLNKGGMTNESFYASMLLQLKRMTQLTSDYRMLPDEYFSKFGRDEKPSKLQPLMSLCKKVTAKQEKAIIFSLNIFSIDKITEELSSQFGEQSVVKIVGGDDAQSRAEVVKEFQENPEVKFMVASLKAANSGITLTASNNVIFYDLWWNPSVLKQAMARAHRIGQTKKVVNVYYLVMQNSIDENLVAVAEAKKEVINSFENGVVSQEDAMETNKLIFDKVISKGTSEYE